MILRLARKHCKLAAQTLQRRAMIQDLLLVQSSLLLAQSSPLQNLRSSLLQLRTAMTDHRLRQARVDPRCPATGHRLLQLQFLRPCPLSRISKMPRSHPPAKEVTQLSLRCHSTMQRQRRNSAHELQAVLVLGPRGIQLRLQGNLLDDLQDLQDDLQDDLHEILPVSRQGRVHEIQQAQEAGWQMFFTGHSR